MTPHALSVHHLPERGGRDGGSRIQTMFLGIGMRRGLRSGFAFPNNQKNAGDFLGK